MCLYPKLIKNPKYKSTKKNGGIIPAVSDPKTLYVPIGCGNCMECKKQKARDWQIRLQEEIKTNNNGKFITLTFSNESIKKLCNEKELKNLNGYELDNAIATLATRRFLERWRKTYKKSLRHWLVTELGHNGTENIHLHGIVWTHENYTSIENHWQYGFIWPNKQTRTTTYVNSQTVNYIIKYVHKIDEQHKYYKSKILTSPGIGSNYTKKSDSLKNKYNGELTDETYRTPCGHKIRLPIYYRNKIYSEKEKESLWINKINKNERWICGEKIKATDTNSYYKLLEYYREQNKKLGYNDDSKNWELMEYEHIRRIINTNKRLGLTPEGYPADWDR